MGRKFLKDTAGIGESEPQSLYRSDIGPFRLAFIVYSGAKEKDFTTSVSRKIPYKGLPQFLYAFASKPVRNRVDSLQAFDRSLIGKYFLAVSLFFKEA